MTTPHMYLLLVLKFGQSVVKFGPTPSRTALHDNILLSVISHYLQ